MKTSKAFSVAVVLTIIGIVISVVGVAGGTYVFCNNWESHKEITVSFKANESGKTTGYYACKCDSLRVYQDEGTNSCKYDLYYKARGQKNYDTIDTDLCFSENDEATSPYSLTSHWWKDVCFKINKTAGAKKASKLVFSLGQSTD